VSSWLQKNPNDFTTTLCSIITENVVLIEIQGYALPSNDGNQKQALEPGVFCSLS